MPVVNVSLTQQAHHSKQSDGLFLLPSAVQIGAVANGRPFCWPPFCRQHRLAMIPGICDATSFHA
ncbi:hypothetical protein MPLSOD_140431 [Mesorhizobium sp. SOD10]|nr:hypothetical protein MPLSOD_140431 [Mesorhizobium sp. SOD10]